VDFSPDEAQQAVTRAAAGVLDRGGADSALWPELGRAGLLALALPGWAGGDGLGVLEVAALLTEVGRRAAPVPALATLMTGVLPVLAWGGREVQETVLAGVATGDTVLTAAVREPFEPMPQVPVTTARLSGGAGVISGVKVGVPYGAAARWALVPARLAGGGTGVAVVDPSGPGASVVPTPVSGAEPECTLRLDDAPVAGLLGEGSVAGLYQLAVAGACCVADGAVAAALAMTTTHVGTRQQFGRPLAAFQAVAQQIADVYVTARTLHLAALSGCWRLAAGRDAADDLDVAAFWLAEHAPAALRTCHHLHGGLGMDVGYPLYRYSALVRDLARLVGGVGYRLSQVTRHVH